LLSRAAAGEGVPVEVLELLGLDPEDPLVIRRGIELAYQILAAQAVRSDAAGAG